MDTSPSILLPNANPLYLSLSLLGVEVLLVLLCLKVLFPEYVHLNRGNHEDAAITAGA
jgi:hypothetical protein